MKFWWCNWNLDGISQKNTILRQKKCEMKISIISCFSYNNIDDDYSDNNDKYEIKMKKQLYTDKNKINGIWAISVKLCFHNKNKSIINKLINYKHIK